MGEENGEETGLEELGFPAVAVPFLPKMDERHVQRPENREQDGVGVAGDDDAGECETNPCGRDQHGVGMIEPKERGQAKKSA